LFDLAERRERDRRFGAFGRRRFAYINNLTASKLRRRGFVGTLTSASKSALFAYINNSTAAKLRRRLSYFNGAATGTRRRFAYFTKMRRERRWLGFPKKVV